MSFFVYYLDICHSDGCHSYGCYNAKYHCTERCFDEYLSVILNVILLNVIPQSRKDLASDPFNSLKS
jgi:uncharacterized membrane protein